jgi:hypothetical protein
VSICPTCSDRRLVGPAPCPTCAAPLPRDQGARQGEPFWAHEKWQQERDSLAAACDRLTAELTDVRARMFEAERQRDEALAKLDTWERIAERDHGAPLATVEQMQADIDELTHLNMHMRKERDSALTTVARLESENAELRGCQICGTLKQPPCRHTMTATKEPADG